MGSCGSKGVAVGSTGQDTADSAASLTGRPPSAGTGVTPSNGSQMRAAARTAWQASARNLRNSLTWTRRRQDSHRKHSSNNVASSDVGEEEIDRGGRGGRPESHNLLKPPAYAAPISGGSAAWQPESSELGQQSGPRGRHLKDVAKVEGASSMGAEPSEDADVGDSCVRSFHIRNQVTYSMEDTDDAKTPRCKETCQPSVDGSERQRKVVGSSSGGSGVLSPFSPTAPASETVDSEGWAVSGPSRAPRSSSPVDTAGPVTGTSPPIAEDASRRPAVEGGGGRTGAVAPAAATVPPVPTALQGLPAAQLPAAAAPAAAAASSSPAASPAEAVQWVIRPGPPVESAYVLGDVLGKGSFGVVRAATHKTSGLKVAVKTIRKSLLREADVSALRREVEILHHLSGHPHISQLLGVYEEPSQLHLVLELYQGGDLFDAIISVGRHSEKAAADVMRTVLSAISYCHAMGVAHRDIKPENFMLTAPMPMPAAATAGEAGGAGEQDSDAAGRGGRCGSGGGGGGGGGGDEESMGSKLKLIDFGLSVFCSDSVPLTDTVGTSYYVAPEVLARCYSRSADVWSAGVILHILLTGYAPFDGRDDQEILRAVQTGKLDLTTDPIWTSISRDATGVLTAMLNRDPSQRATADQLLRMPWLGRSAASCTASTKPLPGVVSERMRRFARMNSFKKEARRVVASLMRPEEVAGLVAQFKALDADGDGKLNVQELRDGLARQELQSRVGLGPAAAGALSGHLREEELQEVVQRSDLDGDGLLDQSEFLGAALPTSVIARQAQQALAGVILTRPGSRTGAAVAAAATAANNPLAAAFAHFDADGSGFITQDELRSALATHHPESQGPDVRALLSRVDRDADGRISYPEFVDMLVEEVDDQGHADESFAAAAVGPKGLRAAAGAFGAAMGRAEGGVATVQGGCTAAGQQPYGYPRLQTANVAQQQDAGCAPSDSGGDSAAAAAAKRRMQLPAAWGVGGSTPPALGAPRARARCQNPTTSLKSTAFVQSAGSGRLSSFDWCDECSSRAAASGEADNGGWMQGEPSASAEAAGMAYNNSGGQSGARGGGGYVPSRLSQATPSAAHERLYRAAEAAALTLLGGGPADESSLLGQLSVGTVTSSTPAGRGNASEGDDSVAGPAYTAKRPPAMTIPPPPPPAAAARRARRHSAAEALDDGYSYAYGNSGSDGHSSDGRFNIATERIVRVSRVLDSHGANGNHPNLPVNCPRQHAAMYPGSTYLKGNTGPSSLGGGGHRTRNRQTANGMNEKGGVIRVPTSQRGVNPRPDMAATVQNRRGLVGGRGAVDVLAPEHLVLPIGGVGHQRGGSVLRPRGLGHINALPYPPVGFYDGPASGGGGSSGRSGQFKPRSYETGHPDKPLMKLHGVPEATAAFPNEAEVLPPGACEEECSPDYNATHRHRQRFLLSIRADSPPSLPQQQQQQQRPQRYPSPSQESTYNEYSNPRSGGGGGGIYSEPLPCLSLGTRGGGMRLHQTGLGGGSGADGSPRGAIGNSPRGDGMVVCSMLPYWEEEES